MRILAIRGKNLASLAEPFEVQLEQGVLKQAGLFAITGPTGSGKSTILDALCLALYDKMPRLPAGHGVAIGHKDEEDAIRVKSHDVSSILRRGTASAYAEVDFIGNDKHSYQARWEISRARGKVNGRLQAQKIRLVNLDTQEKIGEKKTDILEAIEQRIGLTFDQFRRSVLLAQGDFAAFLQAKKDERSNLLEKITGTDIYTELSIAAFERAKQEKQRLDSLKDRLVDKVPLAAEERTELEQKIQQIADQLSELQQQIKDKDALLDWFSLHQKLKQQQSLAEDVVQQSQLSWDANKEDRECLQQVEKVQPLRVLVQQADDLAQELFVAETSLKNSQQTLIEAEIKSKEKAASLQASEQQHSDAMEQHKQAQPLLHKARQLDTQIDSSHLLLDGLVEKSKTQSQQWQRSQSKFDELDQTQSEQKQSLQQLAIWQEQQSAIKGIANEWGRWEVVIKDYCALQAEFQQLNKEKSVVNSDIEKQEALLTQGQIKKTALDEEKNKLIQAISSLEQQASDHSLSDIHQQKVTLEGQKEQFDRAIELAEKCLELRTTQQNDQQTLIGVEDRFKQAIKRLEALKSEQVIKVKQLAEAQQAFNLLQAANQKTAEDLRALLEDEQPCPVCGAEEHPWANKLLPSINQPLVEQGERLATLNHEKDQLITEQSQNESVIKQSEKDKALLSTRITQSLSQLTLLSEKWQITVLDTKPEWDLLEEADILNFRQQSKQLKQQYLGLVKQEKIVLDWQQQITQLRATLETANQQGAELMIERSELEKKLVEQRVDLSNKEKGCGRLSLNILDLADQLNTPFSQVSDWQSQLNQAGNVFLQKIRDEVKQWQKNIEQFETTEKLLIETKRNWAVAESDKLQQHKLHSQYQAEQEKQGQQYQVLVDDRKAYFSGQSANELEDKLTNQIKQTETKNELANKALSSAITDIETSKRTLDHWQTEKNRRKENKIAANQKLETAMQALTISRQTLDSLLTKNTSWIEAQKEKNKALITVQQEASATLKVKNENLLLHDAKTPTESEIQISEQKQQCIQQQQNLVKDKEKNGFLLHADDEKISFGKALQTELKTQNQCWEKWESLNELIGSSTGQKFRVFAQGLTLETLLSYTNRHLQDFAKRYHLQRVPGSDLELQVIDRDMADEVRSVYSLSGGESFLVSLALALGLASLSSNRIQVESLFIDEGFGSLDQETLDIAIASLDTLQSLGRKVGVISHVPVLVERIGAQVVIEKMGGGQSLVRVRGF